MKKFILLSALLTCFFSGFAKHVDEARAKQAGKAFLSSSTLEHPAAFSLQLVYRGTAPAGTLPASASTPPYFYVFNAGSQGFVIVAADDQVWPILGYSWEGSFDAQHLNPTTAKWLEGYRKEIRYIVEQDIQAPAEITREWERLLHGSTSPKGQGINGVNPLVQTKWNQSPYYNQLCPFDNQYNDRAVTGCVATAMAQVMKFWNYPATGTGFHSYNHAKYGTLSANFGSTTYQWNAMPNTLNGTNSAIATLMYHAGISVDMNYGPGASGGSTAYVIEAMSALTHCAEYALKTYFGYKNTMQGIQRVHHSQAQWLDKLKTEFNAGRPVIYAGFGGGGGHCFIADGYDNNDFIHFNWGWGGNSDGFFQINALNPGALGAGGGTGGYNSGHQAIIGIQPPTTNPGTQTYQLKLYNYITPSATSISLGQGFSVSTNVHNTGNGTFNGDYGLAVFDNTNNFVDFVEVKTGQTLQAGYVYTNNLVFTTTGLASMLPGTYYLGLYQRPTGGNWSQVANNGNYTNMVQISVVNASTIELNSAISVTPAGGLTRGQAGSVNLNVKNAGTTTFTGQYQVNLYKQDGSFVETIGTVSESAGLPGGYTYLAPFLTFSTNAVTAAPGTYLLAMVHKSGTGNWQLTGSSNFQNPITVIVKEAAITPDTYEANNTLATAFALPLNFTGNSLSIGTAGSNCHIGSDIDYYKITLPLGYNYTITPRLHDSYNTGNGNTYTLDALFSYSKDGTAWSDVYDDVVPAAVSVNGGTTLYVAVAPYYAGETGTYHMGLNITRTPATALPQVDVAEQVKVWPLPARDRLTIDLEAFGGRGGTLQLLNVQGQQVMAREVKGSDRQLTLHLDDISSGVYMLELKTGKGRLTRKIVIQR